MNPTYYVDSRNAMIRALESAQEVLEPCLIRLQNTNTYFHLPGAGSFSQSDIDAYRKKLHRLKNKVKRQPLYLWNNRSIHNQ